MTTLRLVLGDQLTHDVGVLEVVAPGDVVLMVEAPAETTYVAHHKQKIVLVLSAMRHFAGELRARGLRVDYVTLDDPANTGDLAGEAARAIARHNARRLMVTEPGEVRLMDEMTAWPDRLGVPVDILDDRRFLISRADFTRWAGSRRQLRMEMFYRHMRQRTGVLMDGGAPVGGAWNFDAENRKRWPKDLRPPSRRRFSPDAITREVMDLTAARFPDHFGEVESFAWGVTRADALEALDDFLARAIGGFGDYQDAMKAGAPFLCHGLISPYLNLGLLTASEVCAAAEAAWREGRAPLNAVEGFIRQILGWREFVRGVYWRGGRAFAQSNELGATRRLPDFYWTGETSMRCLAETVRDIHRHAYAHHIQRLMVLGNYALLAGVAPGELETWFLAVFADAFEWVELPNVHGMALFADGGSMSSKPYAASSAYIGRMSDYCAGCVHAKAPKGSDAGCPFDALYWDFFMRHETRFRGNLRLAMTYRTLDKMAPDRRAALRAVAARHLDKTATEEG